MRNCEIVPRAELKHLLLLCCGAHKSVRLDFNKRSRLKLFVCGLEASIHDYEILILDDAAYPKAYVETTDAGDENAVRAARGSPMAGPMKCGMI